MFKKLLPILLGITFAASATAQATEGEIRKLIEAKLGTKVDSVAKSGYLGLYEVYFDGHIVYTDDKVTAILDGNLIDTKVMKNVTDERLRKLTAIKFQDLPLDRAIKQVRGDGKRVLATFEDPNCGYCKRLAKDMIKLDNVTLYTFLLPILSPDSLEKSKRIWCSTDKAKAWNDWMIDGKAPTGRTDCDTTAIQKSVELGQKLAISGTPTIFFADGTRVPGAMPIEQIENRLSQIQSAK